MIITLILMTVLFDLEVTMWGEIWCWSLSELNIHASSRISLSGIDNLVTRAVLLFHFLLEVLLTEVTIGLSEWYCISLAGRSDGCCRK